MRPLGEGETVIPFVEDQHQDAWPRILARCDLARQGLIGRRDCWNISAEPGCLEQGHPREGHKAQHDSFQYGEKGAMPTENQVRTANRQTPTETEESGFPQIPNQGFL